MSLPEQCSTAAGVVLTNTAVCCSAPGGTQPLTALCTTTACRFNVEGLLCYFYNEILPPGQPCLFCKKKKTGRIRDLGKGARRTDHYVT